MYPLTLTAPSFNLCDLAATDSTIFNMITKADMDRRDDDGNVCEDDTVDKSYQILDLDYT